MADALREALERATEGLLYGSESDRPFEFVRFAGDTRPVATLAPVDVAALAGLPGARVTERAAERYLEHHAARFDPEDPRSVELAPRYRALQALMRQTFPVLRAFRVGEVEVLVLALGNDPATGELAGLSTVAVET
jgi:hypothetical protein